MPAERLYQPSPAPPELVLARVAGGDASAVRDCLRLYGPLVLSMARRLAPYDVDDAVQEVFVDVWKSAARFDPRFGAEAAFIATIARRRLIDRRRRANVRRDPATLVPTLPDPSMVPDRMADASMAAETLRQLRPEQQHVLLLAIQYGLSHEEIAEQTGMPLGTVKTHARRGLSKIRAVLLGVREEEPA
jgi:RNA polymerase sigma-70 factor, ECF subfamily